MKKKNKNHSQDVAREVTASGLYAFLLCAPTTLACKEACEHIRYWPYVKEFHPVRKSCGKLFILHVLIGKCNNQEALRQTVQRATELMNKCLQQHQCVMVDLGIQDMFSPIYKSEMFLRPDSLNIPFTSFMKEVDKCNYLSSSKSKSSIL